MSTQINWRVAEARDAETRRLDTALDVHPLARFLSLVAGSRRR